MKTSQHYAHGWFLVLLGLALLITGCSKPVHDGADGKHYQCPMHPWITSNAPGNCTICGMKMVAVADSQKAAAPQEGTVTLGKESLDVLGVATVPVRRIELTKTLRFSGILEDDQNLHHIVAAFYRGRIERVYVDHVGQYVKKGQPLAAIYSPELLYVVREYQSAVSGGNASVARNAAQRLILYGLTPEQVKGMAKENPDVYTIDLTAPISGTVLMRNAFDGKYIETGEPLFEMGDLARLWFHAEVYERDLPDVRIGQKAVLRSPTVPGMDFVGDVTFIDPNFDAATRSTKVRIEVDNPLGGEGGLRRRLPRGAYAEADVTAKLGETLVVPRSAVLRDGRRSILYVEKSTGRFEQRTVTIGRVGDEGVEIVEGVKAGERVVTQGNLMIDAEAQLQGEPPDRPASPVEKLAPQDQANAFLIQLAEVSRALSADDAVAAVKAGQSLSSLAQLIPASGNKEADDAVEKLKALRDLPSGGDLKAVRESFLPWSMAGSKLALALRRGDATPGVRVFECPMTAGSFPGAPSNARWVQAGSETRNPYFGSEMLNCGAEVQP